MNSKTFHEFVDIGRFACIDCRWFAADFFAGVLEVYRLFAIRPVGVPYLDFSSHSMPILFYFRGSRSKQGRIHRHNLGLPSLLASCDGGRTEIRTYGQTKQFIESMIRD